MTDHNPYAPPRAEVRDAAPQADDGLASRGLRLTAVIVDSILQAIIALPVLMYTGYFERAIAGTMSYQLAIGVSAAGAALFVALHGYWLAKHGQTIGKRWVGTRIVNVSDDRVPKLTTTLGARYGTMWLISMIPGVGSLLSLVDVLLIFRRDRRCLHDLVAGTRVVVVRDNAVARPRR